MVLLHLVPVAAERHAPEERDVVLERVPPRGRERDPTFRRIARLAELGVREPLGGVDDQIDPQIAQLASPHRLTRLVAGPRRAIGQFRLGDGGTNVDSLVANLGEVLGAEVIVKELVPVVEIAVADVEKVKIRANREHRQPAPDELLPPQRHRAPLGLACRFEPQREQGGDAEEDLDAREVVIIAGTGDEIGEEGRHETSSRKKDSLEVP
jgi:hypothetical protein